MRRNGGCAGALAVKISVAVYAPGITGMPMDPRAVQVPRNAGVLEDG